MRERMVVIITILFVFVILWISGCGQMKDNSSVTSFYPHVNGAVWRYKYSRLDQYGRNSHYATEYFNGYSFLEDGLKVQNYYVSEETEAILSVSVNTVNAFELFLTGFYYIDNTGVYYYWSTTEAEAQLILPLPLEVGNTWKRNDWDFKAVTMEEISTPAGIFKVIRVERQNPTRNECYEWYADGIGLIKSVTKAVDVRGGVTMEISVTTQELISKNF